MDISAVHFKSFPTEQVQRVLKAFDDLPSQDHFKDGHYVRVPKRLSVPLIEEQLGCSSQEAMALLGELVELGYLLADRLIPTTQGMALINARTEPRISRAQAQTIVDRLVEVAEEESGRPNARMFIEKIEVFGSYVSNKPDLGDVDVVVSIPLIDDLQPEDMDEMDRLSSALQAVSPYVSLHDELDLVASSAKKVTIYVRGKGD
ncbi:MAG: hypothetical protein HYX47_01975 [Burkholderiales bacterium]|nr:hypothetical protein [Burkholderiales bacterium]